VNILLLECWRQPHCLGDFTLCKALSTLSSLENNVFSIDFVETVASAFDSNQHEVNRNVRLVIAGVEILLHETDDDLSLFCNRQSELRIVKPPVVCILFCMRILSLFIAISLNRVCTTGGVALPFSGNGVLAPARWEELAYVDAVIVSEPILPAHPPVSVIFERVVQAVA